MEKLLSNRLSVLGRKSLKKVFCSTLVFALKNSGNMPEERMKRLVLWVEEFGTKTGVYVRFRELNMREESVSLWLWCLASGVYAFQEFEEQLRKKIYPLLRDNEIALENLWLAFAEVYAWQLLLLGGQTICKAEHLFNQKTVWHFITYPETVHGAEIINDIPPLLDHGYIYLNRCGENQQSDWHRDTFLDSYFLALTSYRDIIAENELKKIFRINSRQLAEK